MVGFGQRHTPAPFVTACERFIYTENLGESKGFVQDLYAPPHAVKPSTRPGKKTLGLLKRVLDDASDDEGWLELSRVGETIMQLKSDFDVTK